MAIDGLRLTKRLQTFRLGVKWNTIYRVIPVEIDLLSLHVSFSQYRSCDNTLENCFVQISSYSRAYLRINYEKTKGEVPLGPLLGKQNIQAKEVYEVMNKWKSYTKTARWKNKWKKDHRRYRRNFCICEKKAWNFQACTVLDPLTSAILVQRSYQLS